MSKHGLTIGIISVIMLGVGATAIAQVQSNGDNTQNNTPETSMPQIVNSPANNPSSNNGQTITTEPDPEASWDIPKELIDENQNVPPDIDYKPPNAKQTLKDANYDGVYQADTYNTYSAEDQKIIDSTPHRKREIEPAKQAKLMELSRIFGSLHALRISCVGNGDQTYRSKMATMLDLEAPSAEYIRDPLIIAFNSGFESYGQGQNPCPKDKDNKEASLAKEGRSLSLQMAAAYRTAIQNKTQPKF